MASYDMPDYIVRMFTDKKMAKLARYAAIKWMEARRDLIKDEDEIVIRHLTTNEVIVVLKKQGEAVDGFTG